MQDHITKIDDVIPWGTFQQLTPEQRAVLKQNWDFIIENYPRVRLLSLSSMLYLENQFDKNSIYANMVTVIGISNSGVVNMATFKESNG